MCLHSPAKIADDSKEKNKKERQENAAAIETMDNVPIRDYNTDYVTGVNGGPNYVQTTLLLHAAGCGVSQFTPVGFRVLKLRADKLISEMCVDSAMELRRNMETNWNCLLSETNKPSFRSSTS